MTGNVVESSGGQLGASALDADFDLSPLLLFAILALEGFLEDFGTTKEDALGIISPLVELSTLASSDLASWHFMLGQCIGNAGLLELEDIAALFHAWGLWVDVDLLSVDNPLVALESGPLFVLVLIGVTIMMPVALVPGPVVLPAIFVCTPVVELTAPPLVPDTFSSVPEPWV